MTIDNYRQLEMKNNVELHIDVRQLGMPCNDEWNALENDRQWE